jgi:uncharacterized protein (DUF1501 family)
MTSQAAGSRANCAFKPSRRGFIQAGWFGSLGLSLGAFLKMEAAAKAAEPTRQIEAKAKSVIHIYLQGGFAHMDSFDPKPDAPAEYRGILDAIETKLPGARFSQHMAKTAAVADKLTIVRSMTHTEVDHSRGQHSMFTGYRPSPALVYPSFGSVTALELGVRNDMPPFIAVPTAPQYLGSGYLSNQYNAFSPGGDVRGGGGGFGGGGNTTGVRDLTLPSGVDETRFASRKEWKELVDENFAKTQKDDSLVAMDSFYQRAYGMLASPTVREAFGMKGETEETKKLYGMAGLSGPLGFRNAGAQRFLQARRLVEAGARFVTITFGSWDTHAFHYNGIETQMPIFDIAFAGLVADLDQRGMLDSTLIVVNSEFGRTPKINAGGGRDHWPRVFSIVLAGGGIKRGQIYGASDALAAEPAKNPLSVEDYAHTIYTLLGINPKKDLMSPGNRPQQIVMNGKMVPGLLA